MRARAIVRAAGAATESGDRSARVAAPEGRAEPGEGRHEGAPRRCRPRSMASASSSLDAVDEAHLVAQPLHGGTGDEGRALDARRTSVRARRGPTRRSSRVRRTTPGASCAGVGEDEGAGAVGGLDDARLEAGLTEECRLLVAEHRR